MNSYRPKPDVPIIGGELPISAVHGHVEQMVGPSPGVAPTQRATFPAPPNRMGRSGRGHAAGASLAGVAPAFLDLLNIEKPAEMTGRSLLT